MDESSGDLRSVCIRNFTDELEVVEHSNLRRIVQRLRPELKDTDNG